MKVTISYMVHYRINRVDFKEGKRKEVEFDKTNANAEMLRILTELNEEERQEHSDASCAIIYVRE